MVPTPGAATTQRLKGNRRDDGHHHGKLDRNLIAQGDAGRHGECDVGDGDGDTERRVDQGTSDHDVDLVQPVPHHANHDADRDHPQERDVQRFDHTQRLGTAATARTTETPDRP